ncbi:restriction endonuclease [Rothia nasimurium]|uniref:restriction endonuclease n=1 Tax=Rothia nasimurium TaxID=85336 RepID=UPI001F0235BF|nr:restriction endonuclease [Rothia nasimurium]
MSRFIENIQKFGVSADDYEAVPQCFDVSIDDLRNEEYQDIPRGVVFSAPIVECIVEGLDVRLYGSSGDLYLISRNYLDEFIGRFITPYSSIIFLESLIKSCNNPQLSLVYKEEDIRMIDELGQYVEYSYKLNEIESLYDEVIEGISCIHKIENSHIERIDAVCDIIEDFGESRLSVDSARIQSVADADSRRKGELLESLICDAFYSVGGLRIKERNLHAVNQEIDIVVENFSQSFLPFSGANYVIVECKNWSSTVGRSEFDAFENKVKDGGYDVGVFVAWPRASNEFKMEMLKACRAPYKIILIEKNDFFDKENNVLSFRQVLENSYTKEFSISNS